LHSAFTDLVHFENRWYCAFREGTTHMSLDGKLRVLVSDDLATWHTLSTIVWQGGDLRDPKFSIRPDNVLMLTAGMRWSTPLNSRETLYSLGMCFNALTQAWTEPVIDVYGKATWRWAVAWHGDSAYSVGYAGRDRGGCLYHSKDGLKWRPMIVPFFPVSDYATNETTLAFSEDQAWCVVRRDAKQGVNGMLGFAQAPFEHWQWMELSDPVGGQKLLILRDGRCLLGTRSLDYETNAAEMVIQELCVNTGELRLFASLPSSGDCSYPGMVEHDKQLVVSYYSSHEDGANIYLAQIML
jgi:hypothetical protein